MVELLRGGHAHRGIEDAVSGFPPEKANDKPEGAPYTPWQLLEHIRISQWDVLQFIINPDHQSPEWPKGYWPDPEFKADSARWERTVNDLRADRQQLIELVEDPNIQLTDPIPNRQAKYSLLREVLIVADHSAYHIGEFGILRELMGV